MRLSTRSQYVLYIGVLHAVLIFLVYKLLFEDKLIFIASEVFLLLSLAASIRLYQAFIQPNEFVKSGIEAIKDKDFTIRFVPTGKGEVDTLIEVYNLMIDQLREERTKLHEQHFFLEKLIAASPISIIILDFDNRIATLNAKAEAQFSLLSSEAKGKKLTETKVPFLASLQNLPDGQSSILTTNGVEKFKVQRSYFMDQGFRRSFLLIEELTNELLELEKKAYGKVIRMMAHEVNNTLGATDSILQTTANFLITTEFSELREALQVASDRNRRLTRFMRNFADVVRLPPPAREPLDFSRLIHEVGVFMYPFAAERGIELESDLAAAIAIRADAGQMEQVLVNVIKNAVEACTTGHRVVLSLTEQKLVIKNNGKPISTDEAEQLFNPFYSSKANGQGIGLTLTREILLNHGFRFSLSTREDGWTEFVVVF